MKVYGQLEEVALENLASDPSNLYKGRIWYNTTTGKIMFRKDGSLSRAVLLNDSLFVIGNSGTAANNVRVHRGDATLLQFVPGNDSTVEGTLSTTLGKLSFKFESYTTAGRPAFGNAGRMIWDSDLSRLYVDTGSAWDSVGFIEDNEVTTSKIADSNVTTAKIADLNVTTGKIADDAVTLAKLDPDFIADVEVPTTATFNANQAYGHGFSSGNPSTTDDYLIYSDGDGLRVNAGATDTDAETNHIRKVKVDDIYLSTNAKREMQAFKNAGAATITSLGFVAAPTLTATAASDETDRPWLKHTTAATANTSTGIVTSTFTQFNMSWDPEFEIAVKVDGSQGINRHAFVGFVSASVDGTAGNTIGISTPPAIKYVGFYFYITSSSGPGTDEWSFNPVNATGAGGAGSETATNADWWYTMADGGQAHVLKCAVRKGGTEIWFWINNRLVAIHTTDIPTGAMGFAARATTRQATATSIWWSNLTIKHN